MIITDVRGGKLELSKTRLTEVAGGAIPEMLWYLPLKTLARAGDYQELRILSTRSHDGNHLHGYAKLELSSNRIGCRYFDDATFKKIMKAARATTKKKAKAKKK